MCEHRKHINQTLTGLQGKSHGIEEKKKILR